MDRVRAWWRSQPAGERALRLLLGAGLVVTAALAAVQVAQSYEHPRVETVTERRQSLVLPVVTVCPEPAEAVTNISAYTGGDKPRVYLPTSVLDDGGGVVCYVFDTKHRSSQSGPALGLDGLGVEIQPRNSSLSMSLYVRWVPPTSFSRAGAGGRAGLLPEDPGEINANVVRVVIENRGDREAVSTWAMRLTATEYVDLDGSVTLRSADLDPIQVFDPTSGGAPPDLYVFYKDTRVVVTREYVALGLLYFIGTVGGAFSVAKFVVFLYVSATAKRGRQPGDALPTADQPLL